MISEVDSGEASFGLSHDPGTTQLNISKGEDTNDTAARGKPGEQEGKVWVALLVQAGFVERRKPGDQQRWEGGGRSMQGSGW
jgi:hypothetical protein